MAEVKKKATKKTKLVLSEIQKNLKAPKGQRNKFGNYNYRKAEDILEAVKALMPEGFVVKCSDELVMIGERYYIKATAYFGDVETENHVVTGFAREEENKKGMDGSQITGASSSYARKYALNGLFAIDDTKDSDETNQHGKGAAPKATPKVTAKPTPTPVPKPAAKKAGKTGVITEEQKTIIREFKTEFKDKWDDAKFLGCMTIDGKLKKLSSLKEVNNLSMIDASRSILNLAKNATLEIADGFEIKSETVNMVLSKIKSK